MVLEIMNLIQMSRECQLKMGHWNYKLYPTKCLAEDMMDMAFPFWTAMFNRCFSQKVSLLSSVFSDNLFPISCTMFLVVGPNTPEVSIAIGSNLYLLARSEYFDRFAFSAFAAAWPTSIAELLIVLSANVLTQVASQQRILPWLKGKRVMPSGLLPSPRFKPAGSSSEGTPADFKARHMMSFKAECRGNLPSPKWQDNWWYPYSSTFFPHLHVYISLI